MQIVIDIDDNVYTRLFDNGTDFYEIDDILAMASAIRKGTPIPGNSTNGDVLINLYPNLKYTIQNGRVLTTIGVASSFDLDWWNSPYQKGGKDG